MYSNLGFIGLLFFFLGIAADASRIHPRDDSNNTYDYVVVGSGPGGGITASNLARAGYSVLLIEAGRDESNEIGTVAPALQFTQPASTRWRFFVKHYSNQTQELRNNLLTWQWPNGSLWTGSGTNAPKEVKLLGVYYPRGSTLGGSAIVNAMACIYPNDADWDYIARITGDNSWGHEQMRDVLVSVEKNEYLKRGAPGHGFDGIMPTSISPSSFYQSVPARLALLKTVAAESRQDPDKILDLLQSDPNFLTGRDKAEGVFGLAKHQTSGFRRWSPRDAVHDVLNATNADGSKKYHLTLQLQSLASKIIFQEGAGGKPRAVGIEFLEGAGVYKATTGYDAKTAPTGVLKRAYARREVVVSGGTFNSPQLLQLSGIGDRDHLEKLGIKVVAHLPGVGKGLRDNQEMPVVGHGKADFSVPPDPRAANCTSGKPSDPCLAAWLNGTGPYTNPTGNSEVAFLTTKHSPDGNRDMLSYMGSTALRGFFISDPSQTLPVDPPNTIFRTLLRTTVQNNAGHVLIRTTDPRDVPDINFQYFGVGSDSDLGAMVDFTAWMRRVFAKVPAPYGPVEVVEPPCPAGHGADGYCLDSEQDKQWMRDQTFGHHPVGTCRIGGDNDTMAVVDSRFRVRGVDGLRVVDASVFPNQPGAFPVMPTVVIGQKASAIILEDAKEHH